MDTYLSEQEQIARIKGWLQQNGLTLLIILALAATLSFGWHRWQSNKERALTHASVRYQQLLNDLAQNNITAAHDTADYLIKRYPQTAYASLAKLIQAKLAIDNKAFALANTQFDWVIKHAKSTSIKQIARIRKARVLLTLEQPQTALTLLQKIDEPGFIAMIEAVKGDSYNALGQIDNARVAYQIALQNLPTTQSMRPLIQMKLDNLTVIKAGV